MRHHQRPAACIASSDPEKPPPSSRHPQSCRALQLGILVELRPEVCCRVKRQGWAGSLGCHCHRLRSAHSTGCVQAISASSLLESWGKQNSGAEPLGDCGSLTVSSLGELWKDGEADEVGQPKVLLHPLARALPEGVIPAGASQLKGMLAGAPVESPTCAMVLASANHAHWHVRSQPKSVQQTPRSSPFAILCVKVGHVFRDRNAGDGHARKHSDALGHVHKGELLWRRHNDCGRELHRLQAPQHSIPQ